MKNKGINIFLAYYVGYDGDRYAKPCATLEGAKQFLMSELLDYCEASLDGYDEECVRNDFEKESISWDKCPTSSYEYEGFYSWIELESLHD